MPIKKAWQGQRYLQKIGIKLVRIELTNKSVIWWEPGVMYDSYPLVGVEKTIETRLIRGVERGGARGGACRFRVLRPNIDRPMSKSDYFKLTRCFA